MMQRHEAPASPSLLSISETKTKDEEEEAFFYDSQTLPKPQRRASRLFSAKLSWRKMSNSLRRKGKKLEVKREGREEEGEEEEEMMETGGVNECSQFDYEDSQDAECVRLREKSGSGLRSF